jgi:hypothetical protein
MLLLLLLLLPAARCASTRRRLLRWQPHTGHPTSSRCGMSEHHTCVKPGCICISWSVVLCLLCCVLHCPLSLSLASQTGEVTCLLPKSERKQRQAQLCLCYCAVPCCCVACFALQELARHNANTARSPAASSCCIVVVDRLRCCLLWPPAHVCCVLLPVVRVHCRGKYEDAKLSDEEAGYIYRYAAAAAANKARSVADRGHVV